MEDERKEKMLRHVQYLATDTILEWLLVAHLSRFPNPAETADDLLGLAEAISDQMTFPEAGPEWSDLAAQEFRDCLVRKIHRAKALATGDKFDPSAFLKRAPNSEN